MFRFECFHRFTGESGDHLDRSSSVGKQTLKMATEVGIAVRGKSFCQALFVDESQWLLPLSELRVLMIHQQLDLPNEFKFLTTNGNIVSAPAEDTLTLREVIKKSPIQQSGPEVIAGDNIDHEKMSVKNPDSHEGSVPIISLLPTDISPPNSSDGSPDSTDSHEQCHCDREETAASGRRSGHGCPVVMLKEAFPLFQDFFQPKKLLKVVLILSVTLAILMATLTCMLHMALGAVGGLAGHPFLGDMFRPQTESSAVSELRVQLSELEVTSKFELKDLKQKLSELEDLYLRDLEMLRREMATVKAKQAELETLVVKEMQNMKITLDNMISEWQLDEGEEKHHEMEMEEEREKEKRKYKNNKNGEKKKTKPNTEKDYKGK